MSFSARGKPELAFPATAFNACKTETEQGVQCRQNPDKLHILIHLIGSQMIADAENNRE